MKNVVIDLPTEKDSSNAAAALAVCLSSPLFLTFRGEIGAGKTTFIRAMLRKLGVNSAVKSPTFSLVESYQLPHLQIHHFDLYRIQDEEELEYIGFRDYFSRNSVCCVEWPERVSRPFAGVDLDFAITIKGMGREMNIRSLTPLGDEILSCIAGGL
jgi:tRNA threonylcarbamoyladenosine biosynthesis protein TsaE